MKFKAIVLYVSAFGLGGLTIWFIPFVLNYTPIHHDYTQKTNKHYGVGEQGQMQHSHDEVNMPGLQGKDTSEEEVHDLKIIFKNHKEITRSVEIISNGIRTITETKNENLRGAIVNHVVGMVARLEEKRDPQIVIQSPTLDKLFEGSRSIKTEVRMTELGVEVIQTSTEPDIVEALHKHAVEVSDMAKRGMAAIHERMSK
jgi:hypothetical protein